MPGRRVALLTIEVGLVRPLIRFWLRAIIDDWFGVVPNNPVTPVDRPMVPPVIEALPGREVPMVAARTPRVVVEPWPMVATDGRTLAPNALVERGLVPVLKEDLVLEENALVRVELKLD